MNKLDLRETLARSQPRSKWRKRFLRGSLILIPLCLAVAFVYFVLSSDQELGEAFAEADMLDPGWRIPELEQKRRVIPDEENSAPVVLAATKLMPPGWPLWYQTPIAPIPEGYTEEEVDTLRESFNVETPVPLGKRQTALLRGELRRAEKALVEARKLADLPRGRYPRPYTPYHTGFTAVHIQNLQDVRSIRDLLAYDVLLRAQDGDVDGALTSCRGVLNCGRSIGDEPWLASMRTRVGDAPQKVERTLAQGQPSEMALAAVQREFEDEAAQPLLLIGVRGERAIDDGLMRAIQDGVVNPSDYTWVGGVGRASELVQLLRVPAVAKRMRASVLKFNNRLVEIAKLPVGQQLESIKDWLSARQDLPHFAQSFVGSRLDDIISIIRNTVELRCAVAMVALERYRLANNRWPDALTDLVPMYLSQLPLDPFDGALLRYRRLDDGVVIYSIGPDGKDDGGKLDQNRADLGFRLWDVAKRRQPPKPPKAAAPWELP